MDRTWSTQQQAIFSWFEKRSFIDTAWDRANNLKNLVVRARAGTGKTTTIIEGINRAPEQSIILCAFNKRIAEELAGRITNPNARAQTLHSLGFRCVLKFWENIHVEKERGMRADTLTERICGPRAPDVIKRLVSKLHTKGREIAPHAMNPGDLTDIAYDFECNPDDSWARGGFGLEYVERNALAAMQLAAEEKPLDTGIDFADMIYLPVRNHWLIPEFDLVVVDEAQDMTVAQLEIAMGVCDGRLAVVGDDRQAIYGFRGADSGSLDRLKRELNAVELPLTVTYRCGQEIVNYAKELVPDFEAGPHNPPGRIEDLAGEKLIEAAEPGDFILSRLNAPLVDVAMSLIKNQKRARIAGRDIGAGLRTLVRKLARGAAAASVPQLLARVAAWEEREVARFTAAKKIRQIDAVRDKADMLRYVAEDAKSVQDIEKRIDSLFTDDGLGQAGVITCSSVHRAKGLEANRVFVLRGTLYPRGRHPEEVNIEYVAVTRAKETLVWVD